MAAKIVCICGTTASGKTSLSVSLAQSLKTDVLCVDASQAFKYANIGTAKITAEESKAIHHRLIDFLEPSERLQAGHFVQLARQEIQQLGLAGKTPLLCVGTSMYLRLLLEGIAATGRGDPRIRAELEERETEDLFTELTKVDSLRAAELHKNDRLRIIRALEIFYSVGKPASELYASQEKQLSYDCLLLILCWNRDLLAERIEQRTAQMLKSGLIDEGKMLLGKYGINAQIFESIGYSEMLGYFQNEINEFQLGKLISTHTRQLAKRQLTFWRRFPQKVGFELQPAQNFKFGTEGQGGTKRKNDISEINTVSMDLPQIQEAVRSFMKDGGRRAIYIDAAQLFIKTRNN